MIRYAIDNGVNYVGHGLSLSRRQSEVVLGKALRDGYREKVKLATKLPTWMVQGPADFDRLLDEQLRKLGDRTHRLLSAARPEPEPLARHRAQARPAGEVGAGHGRRTHRLSGLFLSRRLRSFEEIVNGYERWDFCQIQYNYMDTETQASSKGWSWLPPRAGCSGDGATARRTPGRSAAEGSRTVRAFQNHARQCAATPTGHCNGFGTSLKFPSC